MDNDEWVLPGARSFFSSLSNPLNFAEKKRKITQNLFSCRYFVDHQEFRMVPEPPIMVPKKATPTHTLHTWSARTGWWRIGRPFNPSFFRHRLWWGWYDTIRYAAANLIREHDTIDISVVAETQQGNDCRRMDETLMASLGTCCLPGGYATATVDGKAGANGRGLLLFPPFSKRVTFHS